MSSEVVNPILDIPSFSSRQGLLGKIDPVFIPFCWLKGFTGMRFFWDEKVKARGNLIKEEGNVEYGNLEVLEFTGMKNSSFSLS